MIFIMTIQTKKNVEKARKAIEISYEMLGREYICPGRIKGIIPPAPLWQGLSRTEFFCINKNLLKRKNIMRKTADEITESRK